MSKTGVFLLLLLYGVLQAQIPAYSLSYNKSANPYKDLEKALKQAKKEHKKVLLIVGGDWCKWCGQLENFLDDHQNVKDELYKHFEVVKVYYARDMNKEAKSLLSQFPKVEETPFFYVLNDKAKLLNVAKSSSFERGFSYNTKKFLNFIKNNSGEKDEK